MLFVILQAGDDCFSFPVFLSNLFLLSCLSALGSSRAVTIPIWGLYASFRPLRAYIHID